MNEFFMSILEGIYSLVGNYGVTVILFTLLIRLVLSPFDFKSRKSMKRMEKLNPKLQALQKKYANDKEKLQKKQAELYKKEKVNPLGSCLPMLLTLPVLFIMFGAMRGMANEQLVRILQSIQAAVGDLTDPEAIAAALPAVSVITEPFLWIKNLWLADSPSTSILPAAASALAALGGSIAGVINADEMIALKQFVDSSIYQTIILPHYGATVLPGASINIMIATIDIFKNPNGYFVLPLLSGASQYFTTLLTPQPAPNPAQQKNGGMGMQGMMKWFFPIFSIWICATSTAAFALYWVTTNVLSMVQTVIFTRYFNAQDKKAALDASSQEGDLP